MAFQPRGWLARLGQFLNDVFGNRTRFCFIVFIALQATEAPLRKSALHRSPAFSFDAGGYDLATEIVWNLLQARYANLEEKWYSDQLESFAFLLSNFVWISSNFVRKLT